MSNNDTGAADLLGNIADQPRRPDNRQPDGTDEIDKVLTRNRAFYFVITREGMTVEKKYFDDYLSDEEARQALERICQARVDAARKETTIYVASMLFCPLGTVCSAHQTHDLTEYIAAIEAAKKGGANDV